MQSTPYGNPHLVEEALARAFTFDTVRPCGFDELLAARSDSIAVCVDHGEILSVAEIVKIARILPPAGKLHLAEDIPRRFLRGEETIAMLATISRALRTPTRFDFDSARRLPAELEFRHRRTVARGVADLELRQPDEWETGTEHDGRPMG